MNLNATRQIDPNRLTVGITFEPDDFERAFGAAPDPDEQLFYDLLGPGFKEKPVSAQLERLAALAALVETRAAVLDSSLSVEARGT